MLYSVTWGLIDVFLRRRSGTSENKVFQSKLALFELLQHGYVVESRYRARSDEYTSTRIGAVEIPASPTSTQNVEWLLLPGHPEPRRMHFVDRCPVALLTG